MPSKIGVNNAKHTEIGRMGYHSEINNAFPHQISNVKGSKSSMLHDKDCASGSAKHIHSSIDRNPEIIQNINNGHSVPSKTPASSRKQGIEKKAIEVEELVKYMSNVPRYLQRTERGDNLQGSALNFGVLDWGHVEKWKHKQEQGPGRKKTQSASSSHSTSSLSTFESSDLSSKSSNSSLLQKEQSSVNSLNHHRTSSSSNEDCMDFKLKKGKTKALDMDVISARTFRPLQDKTSSSNSKVYDFSVSAEVKINGQNSEPKKRPEQLTEKNQSIPNPTRLLVAEPSDQLDQRTQSAAIGRDSSQICQLSTNLHNKTESSNFKAGLDSQSQLKMAYSTATSGSVRTDDSDCLENLSRGQEKTSTKARFSPLRRMLDPIMKSRALNHLNPVQELPTMCGSRSPPIIQLNSSTGQSVKKNLNFSSWGSRNTHGSSLQGENNPVASTQHAFLHLMCKNGLPVFTFSFNNDGDFLVATMRKIFIPKKDAFDWIYTFHFVNDTKKSGGWLNQGKKDRRQGHPCDLIGQMNMSSSLCPNFTRNVLEKHLLVTEFVLLAAETGHPASHMLESVPNRELAAIVIEVLLEKTASFNVKNGHRLQNQRDTPVKDLNNQSEETKYSCCLQENLNAGMKEPKSLYSVKVILPGGNHGLPATEAGKPSPLIDRWKSGGSCDCGGWDVGCRLTVLSNTHHQCESLSSTQGCSAMDDTIQVDLFVQGTREDRRHAFSLTAIKEGLYSVEFSESLSLLQAFSICLAILHGKKPAILSPVDFLHRAKSLQETTEDNIKTHKRDHGEAHVSNVPYPPLSPVGRV